MNEDKSVDIKHEGGNVENDDYRNRFDLKGNQRAYQPSFIRDSKRAARSNFSARTERLLVLCHIKGSEFKF